MANSAQLASQVAGLTALAAVDVEVLLRQAETVATAQLILNDALPLLIATYGEAAAAIAADWYDERRDELEVPGRFTPILPVASDRGAHALIGWAATEATSDATFTQLIKGGMQRRIANAGRDVITQTSTRDPRCQGWRRVGVGEDCDFCRLLIGRGNVYRESTVHFEAHDFCNCVGEPVFA